MFTKSQRIVFPVTLTGEIFSRLCPSWRERMEGRSVPLATFLLGTVFPSLILLSRLRIARDPAAKAYADGFVLFFPLTLFLSNHLPPSLLNIYLLSGWVAHFSKQKYAGVRLKHKQGNLQGKLEVLRTTMSHPRVGQVMLLFVLKISES